MASLRERFTVSWDDGEPIEVLTTVTDLIAAVDQAADNGHPTNRVALETSLIHNALVRTGVEVPPYAEWLDLIDGYQKAVMVENIETPTPPGPSDIERSLSVS